MIGARRGDRLH